MVLFGRTAPKPRELSKIAKTVIGGLSGMLASIVLHPLDLVKVRMQLYPKPCSVQRMASKILRCEGATALYAGLSAALMRQATYTTTRLSVYNCLYENHRKKHGIPNIHDKVLFGFYAGLAGAFAGTPAEVALVRLLADGRKDPCCCLERGFQRRYKGVFDAMYKIAHNEGPRSLWRGGVLTLTRGACMSVVQIGTYTRSRDFLKKHSMAEDKPLMLHFYTSVITGFVTATVTLPVDIVKIKYQVRQTEATQKEIFFSIFNTGIKGFWQGFVPYFMRLSIHTTLTYVFLQEMCDMYTYFY